MTETAALLITSASIIAAYESQKNNYQEGNDKIQQAYVQLFELDKYAEELKEKHLPKELKEYGLVITFTYKLALNKRLDYTWKF